MIDCNSVVDRAMPARLAFIFLGALNMKNSALWLALLTMCASLSVSAADLTRAEVEQRLASADKTHVADLKRKDLTELDLSGLDFRKADLWGSDMRRANFSNSNLSGLVLDLTVMSKINLSGADLSKASVFGVHLGGANLSHTNLTGSRFIATLDRSDLSYANLSNVDWGVDMKNQSMGLMRASMNYVNLTGANLTDANLDRALLRYANFKDSVLKNANLFGVDLSGADFSNADLTNANLTGTTLEETNFAGANLTGTRFAGIKDKNRLKGLSESKNLDKAIFE